MIFVTSSIDNSEVCSITLHGEITKVSMFDLEGILCGCSETAGHVISELKPVTSVSLWVNELVPVPGGDESEYHFADIVPAISRCDLRGRRSEGVGSYRS